MHVYNQLLGFSVILIYLMAPFYLMFRYEYISKHESTLFHVFGGFLIICWVSFLGIMPIIDSQKIVLLDTDPVNIFYDIACILPVFSLLAYSFFARIKRVKKIIYSNCLVYLAIYYIVACFFDYDFVFISSEYKEVLTILTFGSLIYIFYSKLSVMVKSL